MANPKIFFFHNPKAGGSYLREVFNQTYPAKTLCPVIENDVAEHENHAGNYTQFIGYDIYAGHYGRDIFEVVNSGHIATTNFRHPVPRVISLYNFFRHSVSMSDEMLAMDRFRAVKAAKEWPFSRFVATDDDAVLLYTRNFHTRQLARSPWEHVEGDMDDAIAMVEQMPWFYVCEFPGLSLVWARERLGWEGVEERTVNGRVPTADRLSADTIDRKSFDAIVENNRRDMVIYEKAVTTLLNVA